MSYVPRRMARTEPSYTLTAPGLPVRAAGTWRELADGAMWIMGKGACLVPGFNPAITVTSGSTATLRFRARPRNYAIRRIWGLALRASVTSTATTATVRSPAGTGTSVTYTMGPFPRFVVPIQYIHDLGARSSAEGEISIDVTAAGGDVEFEWVDCYEQDRAALADDATDRGIHLETIGPRTPIVNISNGSMGAVYDAIQNMDARRVGILHTAVDTAGPFTQTAASHVSISTLAWKLQVPKLTAGSTTAAVFWSTYARMATGGGAGGQVKLTTSVSGVTDTATVTSTSFAWITARSISVACDDFGQVDGFRNDELTITIAGDGTRAIEVATVSLWVDSVA